MARKDEALSRAEIDKAKLLYDAGVAPVAEVMSILGLTIGEFRRFREREGWPMRASPIKRATAAPASAPPRKPARSLIARLEEAVEREFARAEAALDKGAPKSMEASARVLASLVRSLGELKRMSKDAGAEPIEREDDERATDDAPPRQLAELREELARRLERLGGAGEAG